MHENLERRESVKGSSDRSFGFVFCAVFALVALLPLLHSPHKARLWAVPIAFAFAVVALVAPSWLGPLNRLWTRIGLLLSTVVSPFVLGLLFYATIFPIGFLMRLAGKDPLGLRRTSADSYWISRDHSVSASDMKQQF